MGIEPTQSAWKAEILPLNYTRVPTNKPNKNWRGKDSNLRRLSRQIYSLLPLTARVPLQNELGILLESAINVNRFITTNFSDCQKLFSLQTTCLFISFLANIKRQSHKS